MNGYGRTPAERARGSQDAILQAQRVGQPATLVNAAPGAGKTHLTVRVALDAAARGERVIVAAATNAQAADLARRLAHDASRETVALLLGRTVAPPNGLRPLVTAGTLRIACTTAALPDAPPILIGTATRLSYLDAKRYGAELLVVDECYQLTHVAFGMIVALGQRVCLIGDAGQIPPVVTIDIADWRGDDPGPQVACPLALAYHHPWIRRLGLPVTRRLLADTVRVIAPIYYPGMQMEALHDERHRRLTLARPGGSALDRPLDLLESGRGMTLATLPARETGEVDRELAATLVDLAVRSLERGLAVHEGGCDTAIAPRNIGIVCAHVSQVVAVRQGLPRALCEVLVETAERWQGLERALMLVHHPLSGRASDSSAHLLSAARMCVMTTRHRVGCVIVARRGMADDLEQAPPIGSHMFGEGPDPTLAGWHAHRCLLAALAPSSTVVA